MRNPFTGTFPITQVFGINPEDYIRFGLKGHNGIDYGLPAWTPVLAPYDGKILENAYDEGGYGNYIKIESDIEGSVLAHFAKSSVSVGQVIKEGEQVGFSGSTGNSTGPHLHWGYYRIPRDRNNGFNGYIDQTPYIGVITKQEEENMRKAVAFDRYLTYLFSRGLLPDDDSRSKSDVDLIRVFDKLFTDNENHHRGYEEFKTKYKGAEEEIKKLKEELTTAQKEVEVLKNEVQQVKDTADINLTKALADQRDSLLIEWGRDKELWNKEKAELEQIIKDKCKEVIKLIEPPLTDRFAGVSMAKRWKAVLEILSAPKKKI